MDDPSEPNNDGITALHNAVCASHDEVVKFLVEFGVDINSPDSHGWYGDVKFTLKFQLIVKLYSR